MSDGRIRASVAASHRMREQKCTTSGHEDRHAGWLIERDEPDSGIGARRWVCAECWEDAQ